jgi:hypothetical protein
VFLSRVGCFCSRLTVISISGSAELRTFGVGLVIPAGYATGELSEGLSCA